MERIHENEGSAGKQFRHHGTKAFDRRFSSLVTRLQDIADFLTEIGLRQTRHTVCDYPADIVAEMYPSNWRRDVVGQVDSCTAQSRVAIKHPRCFYFCMIVVFGGNP